ncbi:testis-expressed protein 11-like isoform X2 [Mizuhopecten yessoensis]|nr:testis-expressed protein 11-like isoform X2 [Mizuhopecten yessoensis]XP_021377369.1 testis-expressed protein 11-like isoform X2 [Mizuhopecten yessoensis]XP_021377370.1 testis-expressed protein 11-like isoform X2 [Mizuhopecten yessoensis]
MSLVNRLHEESTHMSEEQRTVVAILETHAVNLWNIAVALKTKDSLPVLVNAKLRHVAFLLVDCSTSSAFNENTWKKKIVMGMKAGRAWLDSKDPVMADQVFLLTDQFVASVQKAIVERKNDGVATEAVDKQKTEVLQDVFKLMCYKSEAALAQQNQQKALDLVLLAKEMLPNFPNEGGYLSMLCYNFGVDMYQQQKYEQGVMWLRESFELGKVRQTIGSRNQARTLRLLANAYLEWNAKEHCQKALNAVTLANTEHPHPAGFYLSLRVLLFIGEDDGAIQKAIEDILHQSDVTVDLGLNVVQLVSQHNRTEIAMDVTKILLKTFATSPDVGRIIVSQLELLIQMGKIREAKDFVEESITAHNTGKPLDATVKKRFHLTLWEQAAVAFEAKDYQESLEWYNYTLSLFSHSDIEAHNLAKLYRNRASCYLHLEQRDKAFESAEQAERWEPRSVHTQFILYKVSLAGADVNTAKCVLQKMCEMVASSDLGDDSTDAHSIMCLAAQMAFEENHQVVASQALECVANSCSDPWQVLTALRCLVRLKLASPEKDQETEPSNIDRNIQTAYHKLLQLQNESKENQNQVQNEASWFIKIAWNLALQCDESPQRMKTLFSLCQQLSSLCPRDDNNLTRQKTCMLMAAAAALQVARVSEDEAQKRYNLEEALQHVKNCRQLINQLQQNTLISTENKGKDSTETLLLLYEFEAQVKLNDPMSEQTLEQVLRLPNPDPKTFETLAALAMEPPAQNKNVSVRAIKVAIRKHLQLPQPDFNKCSKLFHSLVQLSLSGDSGTREEALTYYTEVIEVIDKRSQGQYPEMEILWLMTKAWNCGINFYSSGRCDEAERWCSTSLKLLKYLDTMRDNYEDHMNNTYSQILARMERLGTRSRGKSLEE